MIPKTPRPEETAIPDSDVKDIVTTPASQNGTGDVTDEDWLSENPEALASVKRGLEDLAAGRTRKRQSYAEYANIPVED